MDEGRGQAEFRKFLKIFEPKMQKKQYRNDLHIFLVALYGSDGAGGGRFPIGREVARAFISQHKVIYDLNI